MVTQVKLSNNATGNCRRDCQRRVSVQCRMEALFAEVRRRLRSVEVLGTFGVGDLGSSSRDASPGRLSRKGCTHFSKV